MARKRRGRRRTTRTSTSSEFRLSPSLAIFLILVLVFVYFYKVLSPSKMIFATDQISGGIAIRQFYTKELHRFSFPFWDPFLFSGIPFIDAAHGDIFYPTALLRIFLPVHVVMTLLFVIHAIIAGIFMFLLLRDFGVDNEGAFLWAVSFTFTGVFITQTYPGHDGKFIVIALLPGIFLFLRRGMRELKFKWFMLAALLLALDILSPHFQMAYYTYMAIGIYFLFEWIPMFKDERGVGGAVKAAFYFLFMVIVSLAIGGLQLVPSYLYVSKFSPRAAGHRGYEFAVSWSLPWEDYISAFTAKFSGFLDSYWGRNPFKINTEYLGVFAWAFALAAFISKSRERLKWAFLFLFVFFSIMALGGYTPIYKLFYNFLPGVKKFRAASMAFFIVAFSVNVLAALGYKALVEENNIDLVKRVFLSLFLVFLFLALFAGIGGLDGIIKSVFLHNVESKVRAYEANKGIVPVSFIRTAVLLVIATVMAVFFSRAVKTAALFAAFVVVVDLWSNNWQFLKSVPEPKIYYAPDPVVQFLKSDTTVYRVFPLFYKIDDNYLMYHGIESIGGHHGNQFQRYQEFVGEPKHFMFRPNQIPNLLRYPKFTDMLDVKYVISIPLPDDIRKYPPETQRLILDVKSYLSHPKMKFLRYIQVPSPTGNVETYAIYENTDNLGRAFMVQDYIVLDSSKVLDYMKSPQFDPSKQVVFEDEIETMVIPVDTFDWNVEIVSKSPNKIVLHTVSNSDAFLVYSGNWYVYWKAFVDGQEVPVYRADYILRAIEVPAGEHEVVFKYDSTFNLALGGVALVALLIILISVIMS